VTTQSDERPFNLGRTLVDARTAELWRKLSARSLRSFGRQHLGYGDPHGMLELRKSVCDYLAMVTTSFISAPQRGQDGPLSLLALRKNGAGGHDVWGTAGPRPLYCTDDWKRRRGNVLVLFSLRLVELI
jgi:hypothetical protein